MRVRGKRRGKWREKVREKERERERGIGLKMRVRNRGKQMK